MSKVQSRRTISLNRELFEEVSAVARKHNVSLSSLTELALQHVLGTLQSSDERAARELLSDCRPREPWLDAMVESKSPAPVAPVQEQRAPAVTRLAAQHVIDTGCSYSEAARKFGVSPGAVSTRVLGLRVAAAKAAS